MHNSHNLKIIVGLGNPGDNYAKTRHNAGFIAVDKIIDNLGLELKFNKKFNAEICKHGDLIIAKPLTFMNNSGTAVEKIISYYDLLPKKLKLFKEKNADLSDILTVIHDDKDINLGEYKETNDSRSAGHNGVQSIINHLKTQKFKRIRLGVKTEEMQKIPTANFVLQKFRDNELKIIEQVITTKIIF